MISLPKNIASARNLEDLKQQLGEAFNRLEDHLNSRVEVYVLYDKKQRRPTLRKGDIVFDFTVKKDFATLQQWTGKKLAPLNIASYVGLVNLLTQGVGSGTNPTLYLRSDGAGGWVLDIPSVAPTAYYEPLSNGLLPNPELVFDGVTGDIMMHLVASP